jgi:aerobic-type carbon monoxide dehydrogenase small subunit (CoxS/CutS family)
VRPVVAFLCNGRPVDVDAAPNESLLNVLRERLGITSAKDGCAPQGQCGCCTVLVDGEPRVACVTPVARVEGRAVTTIEGIDAGDAAASFVAAGGSQCGFCTPGIIMRFAGTRARDVDRSLAAHLCRCTGWLTVKDAVAGSSATSRDFAQASQRAALEGGPQHVGLDVPVGGALFADDTAPRDALVAVPLPPGSNAEFVEAAGLRWVVAESLLEARERAAKVQGRRTTIDARPPLLDRMPPCPEGGVRLATQWVEPAYLEPDASWCAPGGEPATPLANGGAFGGKVHSPVAAAARELADHFKRPVRTLFSREDAVRLGPKRAPIAAVAVARGDTVEIDGVVARGGPTIVWPAAVPVTATWTEVDVAGPPVGAELRASGWTEQAMLVAGVVRRNLEVTGPTGARARAELVDGRIRVSVAAGDPLDETVLRSYAIGAAHMAYSWVTSEGLAVDPETGEVHDLTIRSFGIVRAGDTPSIEVTIVDDPGEPLAHSSDAVFAAVAAATWLAGGCPETLPSG